MCKALVVCLALAVNITLGQPHDEPHTQRLYNQVTWRLFTKNRILADKSVSVPTTVTGTFWATEIDGERVLVTAAHNLARGPNAVPKAIGDYKLEGNTKLVSILSQPSLGTMSYKVRELGFVGQANDLVLLRPDNEEIFKDSQTITLSLKTPKVGDNVTVYGFPNTSFEKSQFTRIAAINVERGFVILNDPMDKGYSGGVILNEDNQAIGLVITSEAKQATAILLSNTLFSKVDWMTFKDIEPQKQK